MYVLLDAVLRQPSLANFMNRDYNGQFMAEISVSMLKEIIALVRDYLSETRK